MAFLDKTGLEHLWAQIVNRLNGKVDKVSGKGLSTNDYTTAEKNKLAGIAEGANKTVVSTGSTNGTISVNTNGTSADVAVKGLGSAAYTESGAYAPASHTHNYLPLSGGTLTGSLKVGSNTSYNYCDLNVGRLSADGTIGGNLWLAINANGTAAIGHNQNDSTVSKLTFGNGSATFTNNLIVDGTIQENGTLLSSKYAPITHSHDYLPLSGGTVTGSVTTLIAGTDRSCFWAKNDNYSLYFGVAESGNRGIYDSTNSRWMIYSEASSGTTKVAGGQTVTDPCLRNIDCGTTALTAGSSSLTTGTIYVQYE